MINALRWLLVVPMALAGWIAAFFGSLRLYGLIDYFCPADYQVSGFCHHPAALYAENALIVAGAAFSAVLVVMLATITAPAYKSQVAAAALCVGLAVAVWAYLETYALAAFLSSCVAGTVTFLLIMKNNRWRRRASGFHQYELFS